VVGKELLPVLVQMAIAVVGGFLVLVVVLSRSQKTTGRLALPAHGPAR